MGLMLMTAELSPTETGTHLTYRMKFEDELPPEMLAMAVEILKQQMTANGESIRKVASGGESLLT